MTLLKADLHTHSHRSHDCGMNPETIVRTCVQRGIGCIALTDHNTMSGVEDLQKIAPFRVIPGEEIKTSRGEIIGLFLREEIVRGKGPRETAEEIKAQGGIVYVPHPFDRVRRSVIEFGALMEIIDLVDVIEIRNSRITFIEDQAAAERFAKEQGKLGGGGSDAHVRWELGHSYVEIPEFEGPDGFLRALSEGSVHGSLSSPAVHFASSFAKWRKRYLGPLLKR